jgi:isochorismate synthase EntC
MPGLTQESFIKVILATIEESAKGSGNHPEDIMSAILTTTEVCYSFVSKFPSGSFNIDYPVNNG